MSRSKSERMMNLTLLLLTSRTFTSRRQIREAIQGYHDANDTNFERTFERDKDELRALGVPIETGVVQTFFGEEPGYRISRDDFELPPVAFTADEVLALAVAARVWQEESVAQPMSMALAKLRASGLDLDVEQGVVGAAMAVREPAFGPLFDAVTRRRVVRFTYRGKDELRTVEPWSTPSRNGQWYLIGMDRNRGEERCFKLSRITSPIEAVGKDEAYTVPEDHDPEAALARLAPSESLDRVVVAVREGFAPAMTRRGRPVEAPCELPEGFTAHEVPVGRLADAVGEICSHAPHVIALSPAHVRDAVVRQLEHVAGGAQ